MKKRHIAAGAAGLMGAAIAYKFLTRPDTVRWEQAAGDLHHANNSNFAEVDAMRVHYQEFGEENKTPLILIHGYSASTFTWKSVAPLLAEAGFRVLAVDLIGFGYSEKPSWFDYSIVSQARMLARLMDRLGIGTAAVGGNSYGGAIAATLALDYPERVEKLLLVGAVSNDDVLKHPLLRTARVPVVGELITPFLVDSRQFVRYRQYNSMAENSHYLINSARVEAVRTPLAAADGHNSLLATVRHWSAKRIEHDAHLIEQPTLLVWGDSDAVIPIENGRRLHSLIPDSRFIVFKDCGHIPQEEFPQDFVNVVCDFAATKKAKKVKKAEVVKLPPHEKKIG
jgi:pimeloyl-ACP methyl ester carboxylesterase